MRLLLLALLLLASPAFADTARIDAEVRKLWKDAGVTAAPEAEDGEFLRRVTLDLVGRVPTREETAAYLESKDAKKKEKLVDRLLASPDYAEHWADVYMTLMIGRELRLIGPNRNEVRDFFVSAFAANLRYDELAKKILTATGELKDHGEIGFLVAHVARGGSPEAVAGATARVFLGLSIQCAQCHDHPYDKRWKQEDFYGLVAFFARTRGKVQKEGDLRTLTVFDVPRGMTIMTKHKTNAPVIVQPRFLGRAIPDVDSGPRREALARAILASDLFAKAAVNRAWAGLFGHGVVDPVDDLGGEKDDGHPALLGILADDLVASGYDWKKLLREIALSEAYGRSSRGGKAGGDKAPEQVFARAAVRPLMPETLFRSLLLVTNIEKSAKRFQVPPEQLARIVEQGLKQFLFVFGDDEMGEVERFNGNMPQALLLFNGELTNAGTRAAPGSTLKALLDEIRQPEARLVALFMTAYARRPTVAEKVKLVRWIAGDKVSPKAYEDLFYAMLTSTEFVTNH